MEGLEAAGFSDRDGDGLRENRDGTLLHIPITCSDLPISVGVAELVASSWASVGISTEITAIPQDVMVPALMQAEFDVVVHSVSLSEPEMAFFCFHTSRGLVRQGRIFGLNYGGYANPEYDESVVSSLGEQDPTTRRDSLHLLQQTLAADLPQIPLYVPRMLNLYRDDRFVGWTAEPGIGLLNRGCVANLSERWRKQ